MAAAMLTLALVPLLWPRVPPLTDLPGHMARWHIAMNIGESAALARYYAYTWHLVGNLGMDLLVPALARGLGLALATKLAVILAVALTVGGMLACAAEAHRRLPPHAFAALPLAYAWPFQFGFVNFALAQGLAFCAAALWLRLGRQRRLGFRAVVFAPIGCAIWVAHSAGWGLLGLIAFGADLARQRGDGRTWPAAVVRAVLQCLPLALPVLLMILTRDPAAQGGAGGFDGRLKLVWLLWVLRDRWQPFDLASLGAVLVFLYVAARDRRFGFEPLLGFPALLSAAAFLLLPRLAMGGDYVDMRMLPAALALALLAVRPPAGRRVGAAVALLAIAFFGVRTAAGTASFAARDREQARLVAVVDRIPRGAAVLALVLKPCDTGWADRRTEQLPAAAIIARDAFVNDQWDLAGQQLLRIRYRAAAPFTHNPSQIVHPAACAAPGTTFAAALARFPRAAFTHVWTIDAPPLPGTVRDLRLIAASGTSMLYEVVR